MKKITLITLSVFLLTKADSQITKRNWMIGGSGSFRSSKYETTNSVYQKQILLNLSGNVGYFIIDKLPVGLKPVYERIEAKGFDRTVVNVYALGPYARYYFLPSDKYVNIFSELSYQYGITKTNQGSTTNSNNLSGLIGCAAFLTAV
jgi:hypothetical protein